MAAQLGVKVDIWLCRAAGWDVVRSTTSPDASVATLPCETVVALLSRDHVSGRHVCRRDVIACRRVDTGIYYL